MDNIDIYYDNHSEKDFLSILPLIIFEFSNLIKSFYNNKYEFIELICNGKKYEEQITLEDLKKVIKLDSNAFSLELVYNIRYLPDDKEENTYNCIGVYFNASYGKVAITPGLIDKFDSNMVKHEREKLKAFQLELFDLLITKTNPSYINTSDDEYSSYEHLSAEYEYVKDPYWFTVELMKKYNTSTNKSFIDKDGGQWRLLGQIKKLITVKEILEICYKHAKPDEGYYIKYYPETGGLARFSIGHYSVHYPRYFIRGELRRRGIDIKSGNSERDMKSRFGTPWRE